AAGPRPHARLLRSVHKRRDPLQHPPLLDLRLAPPRHADAASNEQERRRQRRSFSAAQRRRHVAAGQTPANQIATTPFQAHSGEGKPMTSNSFLIEIVPPVLLRSTGHSRNRSLTT